MAENPRNKDEMAQGVLAGHGFVALLCLLAFRISPVPVFGLPGTLLAPSLLRLANSRSSAAYTVKEGRQMQLGARYEA